MMHIVAQKVKTVQKCSECMGVTRLPVGILKTGRLGVSGILFLLYTPKKLVGWAGGDGVRMGKRERKGGKEGGTGEGGTFFKPFTAKRRAACSSGSGERRSPRRWNLEPLCLL